MTKLRTLEEVEVRGKKILLRVAYDITLAKKGDEWIVPDDLRIRATLPTIDYLLKQNCSLGFLSWLKRPGGKVVPELSLKPVAKRLSELLDRPVKMLPDCVGSEVEKEIRNMKPGAVLMLENVRFHPEEEKQDMDFAKALVRGFDLIVFDAFAQAMRLHASTSGILQLLPSVSGFLFVKEMAFLSKMLENPAKPFIALLGGAKISDRVEVIENLLHTADKILIGGALANTFFKSQGRAVGKSLLEDVYVDIAKGEKQDYVQMASKLLKKGEGSIVLPKDLVAAVDENSLSSKIVNLAEGENIPDGWKFLDIGPRTIEYYSTVLGEAKTIFANGPMGLFEKEQFAAGTKKLAEVMIASLGTTVIGGGDTESIVARYGWEGKFTHVSTGGGASLEFLAGHEFPVMKYLTR